MLSFVTPEMIVLVVALAVLVVSALDERPFIAAVATLVLVSLVLYVLDPSLLSAAVALAERSVR